MQKYPNYISSVRGAGYMVGLALKPEGLNVKITAEAQNRGLLVVPAGHNVIRLLPALVASSAQLNESVFILDEIFASLND